MTDDAGHDIGIGQPIDNPRISDSDTSGVRVPPPLFYIAGFLVGVALELAFPIGDPPFVVALAGALIGGGLWLALDGAAMLFFIRAGTSIVPTNPTTALITSGPYRFTRNPMYLGMAFLYVALAFALGMIWALMLLPVVIAAVDRLVIAREEAYLVRRFGQVYRDYMTRVRRWL
jgi:protein-S-isoprenylcysteine O-methyltransferase Ste14